jgi:CrcB protein
MGAQDDDPGPVLPIDPDQPTAADLERPARSTRRGGHGRAQLDVLAAIAAGGALGTPARYEMSRLIHVAKDTFPWSTFWTNISGSLLLGFILVLLIERFPPSRYLRPFFAIGFLGAYTTMSTYMVETATLVKDGHAVPGVTYAVASMLAGFTAAWLGILAGRLVPLRDAGRTPPA